MKWHFASHTHRDGVVLIAADSVIGLLRHLQEVRPNTTLEEIATMIEEMIDDGQ